MIKNSLSALAIGFALLTTAAHAGADKACMKKAKADFTAAQASCKSMKGADKKACNKTAKADYATAKTACKAPAADAAPAPEAAPAAAPQ